jgi:hypothetical protein
VIFSFLILILAVYGAVLFATGAAIFWFVKMRLIMATALAAFAAYGWFGLDTYGFQSIPSAALQSWGGLILAVAVGGAGEFIRDRLKRPS